MKKNYLLGQNEVRELLTDGTVKEVEQSKKEELSNLSRKEVALRSQGLAILDSANNLVKRLNKQYAQHFFPLSIVDYAKVAYENARFNKPFPILSIDSHDILNCDFSCQDCLSGAGKNMLNVSTNYDFNLSLEFYLHILGEIAKYSQERGFNRVRFEQSGEGNPDFYKSRAKLIEESKKRFNMDTVYVTTGSKLNEETIETIIENGSFLRISFPGIDQRSYELYSGQKKYSFEDSLKKLERILKIRKIKGKEKDLLIGVRAALRPEHNHEYLNFGKKLREIGADSIQISKILVPDGLKKEDFPISYKAQKQLTKLNNLKEHDFDVRLPTILDHMYYDREIQSREEFPKKCYSSLVQPVLAGRDLFVCTKSEMMYSQQYKLGRFNGKNRELENLLSSSNITKVTKDVPEKCDTCCSIFDNLIIDEIQKLTKNLDIDLKFYEILE